MHLAVSEEFDRCCGQCVFCNVYSSTNLRCRNHLTRAPACSPPAKAPISILPLGCLGAVAVVCISACTSIKCGIHQRWPHQRPIFIHVNTAHVHVTEHTSPSGGGGDGGEPRADYHVDSESRAKCTARRFSDIPSTAQPQSLMVLLCKTGSLCRGMGFGPREGPVRESWPTLFAFAQSRSILQPQHQYQRECPRTLALRRLWCLQTYVQCGVREVKGRREGSMCHCCTGPCQEGEVEGWSARSRPPPPHYPPPPVRSHTSPAPPLPLCASSLASLPRDLYLCSFLAHSRDMHVCTGKRF